VGVTQEGGSVRRAEQILLAAALAMLLLSAGLGAGVPQLGRGASRAHAGAGSLGWLVLAVLAIALGMVGGGSQAGPAAWPRRARTAAIPVSVAVAAAVAANVVARAAGGPGSWTRLAALAAILAFLAMLAALDRDARAIATVPGLGMAGALAVLVAGTAIRVSTAGTVLPFIVLASAAMIEWSAAPAARRARPTTAGLVQVGALVLAAAAVVAGVTSHDLALVEANIPLELGGIAIFLVRLGPALLAAGWARTSRVWLVTSAVALAVDAGLFAHVVVEVGNRRYVSIGSVPKSLLFAVDHVTFVAVGTAAVFGAIAALAGQQARWPLADAGAAAGLVLGLATTIAAIGAGSALFEGIAAALLGVSVLAAAALAGARTLATTGTRCPIPEPGSRP